MIPAIFAGVIFVVSWFTLTFHSKPPKPEQKPGTVIIETRKDTKE
jgi:hypothetical protein